LILRSERLDERISVTNRISGNLDTEAKGENSLVEA
jgi:hypothetical protein